MTPIDVSDLAGDWVVDSDDAVEELFRQRYLEDSNLFWCAVAGRRDPTMSVLVRGVDAAVTYHRHDRDAGFLSQAEPVTRQEDVDFYDATSGSTIQFPNTSIIEAEQALRCMLEFLHTGGARPTAVAWLEL
jgi:hypothetical protein